MLAIRYQIPFKSLGGTEYRIDIYQQTTQGWNGNNIITLTPGPEPIVTEEDDDDDPLVPIRPSTGYISFYLEGRDTSDIDSTLEQMLPQRDTDSPVKLMRKQGNAWAIAWQGFLQAAEYSSDWAEAAGVFQLPIISGLEALKSIEFDASETIGMVSIDELFGSVDPDTHELTGGFYKQLLDMGLEYDVAIDCPKELTDNGGMSFVNWLDIEVMRYNFIEKSDADNVGDPDYTKYTGSFYFDVMSEIMKAFGWCMYERGDSIVMVSRRQGATYAFSQVTTRDLETSDVTYTSADHSRSVMQGCRNVKITAGTNAITGKVLEATTDGMVKANLGAWHYSYADIEYQAEEFETPAWTRAEHAMHHGFFWCLPPKSGNAIRLFYDKNGNGVTDYYAIGQLAQDGDDVQGVLYEYSDYYSLPADTKYNYSYANRFTLIANTGWKNFFHVFPEGTNAHVDPSQVYIDSAKVHNMPVLIITQSDPIFALTGALVLSFNVRQLGKYGQIVWSFNEDFQWYDYSFYRDNYMLSGTDLFGAWNRTIEYSIRVGDKHWSDNQQAWVTGALERCTAEIEEGGTVKNTKTLAMPYNGASGLVLPIETELSGYIEVTFYSKNIVKTKVRYATAEDNIEFYTDIRLALSDISVKYYPLDNDVNNDIEKENKYIAKCQAGSDDRNIELKLATKRQVNGPGYGLMMYDGDYLTDQFTIAGTARRPEEALLELARGLYSGRRDILTVDIANDIHPQDVFTYNGKVFTTLSQSINWADDDRKVKIYQING